MVELHEITGLLCMPLPGSPRSRPAHPVSGASSPAYSGTVGGNCGRELWAGTVGGRSEEEQ
jgi:hypothetical protein